MTELDEVLQRISLAFGVDNLNIILPEDLLVDLSVYRLANIDTHNLDGELVFQSRLFMLFEAILSNIAIKFNAKEAYLKQLEAKLALQYEQSLKAGGDRVSDKKIEALVQADDDYIEAVNDRLNYKGMQGTFLNILGGLEKKHDILIQLSTKRNREIGRDLS